MTARGRESQAPTVLSPVSSTSALGALQRQRTLGHHQPSNSSNADFAVPEVFSS